MTAAWLIAALLVYFASIVITGIYAGTETGMFSLNKPRLRHLAENGNKRAQLILYWAQRQDAFIATHMIGANIAIVTATAVSTAIGVHLLGDPHQGAMAATVISAIIVLVVAEVLPKAIFRQYANRIMLEFAWLLHVSTLVLMPASYLFSFTSKLIFRLLNVTPQTKKSSMGKEELRLILQAGQEEGEFTLDEHEMISQVFDLDQTNTREVMVPLIEAEMVMEDTTIDEFLALARRTGYSRFPVYRERVDRVTGMITVYDVIFAAAPTGTVAGMMHPAHFVPELKPADELLRDLQKQRLSAAVVVDEFGGAVGLVTLELLLEEIVGDIHDEGDEPSLWHKQIGDGMWVVDGGVDIDDLQDELNITLPKEGYDTLAGLIMLQLGRVPRAGEKLVKNEYRLTVLSMDGQVVERVKLERLPAPAAPAAG